MTIEVLRREQYDNLGHVGSGYVPSTGLAVVAKDDAGEICGTLMLVCPWHLEGAWVREDKRGTLALAAMVKKVESVAAQAGLKKLFAYGATPEMENYIPRLGYTKAPLTVWEKVVR